MSENSTKWNIFKDSVYDYDNDCYYYLELKVQASKMWFRFNLRSEIRESSWEPLGDMIPYGDVLFIRLKSILADRGTPADVLEDLIPPCVSGMSAWMRELLLPNMRQLLIAAVVGRALKVWQVPRLEDVFRAVYWGQEEREQLCHALSVSESEFDGAHKAARVVVDTLYGVLNTEMEDASDEAKIAWIKKWSGLA